MALKAVITEDEFGELEEATQSFYTWDEQTERYRLEVEDVDSHPDVAKLRRSHQRSKQEREEAKQKAKDLEKRLGKIAEVDPDINLEDADDETVQRALAILKGEESGGAGDTDPQGGQQGGKKGPDLEKIKNQARKPLEKELEQIKAERDQYVNELNRLIRDQALTEALSQVQVAGPYVSPLKSYFGSQIKIEADEDGQRRAMIETEYGDQPVQSYIKEWAASDEGKAFIAGHTGGGATGSRTNGQKKRNPWLKGQEDFNEQMRLAREEPDLARQMAKDAGKRPNF